MLKTATAILVGVTAVTIAPNSTYAPLDETPSNPAHIEVATTTIQYTQPIGPELPEVLHNEDDQDKYTLKALALEVTKEQGLSTHETVQLLNTVQCESEWNPDAVGDGGHAFGLAQINTIYHPDISPEQAHDPHFALTFIAENFAKGNHRWWTCWRNLYL